MIYTCTQSLSILNYYLKHLDSDATYYRYYDIASSKELAGMCSRSGPVLNKGGELVRGSIINIVSITKGVTTTSLVSGLGSDTYICTQFNPKLVLRGGEELVVPKDTYLAHLGKVKPLLNTDAYEWLEKRYSNYPAKLGMELIALVERFSVTRRRLTLDEVLTECCPSVAKLESYSLLGYLGTEYLMGVLSTMTDSQLWFSINGPNKDQPSYRSYLIDRSPLVCQAMEYLTQAVSARVVGLRAGVVILNQWLLSKGVRVIDKRESNFQYTLKVNELESIWQS